MTTHPQVDPPAHHASAPERPPARHSPRRALASHALLAAALAALTTCLDNPAVQCADGRLCAPGTVCSPRGECVLAEQLDTCLDKPDFTPCSYPRVPDGICARGVCVPAIPVCGDGAVDPNFEACDEGAANADTPDATCRTNCQPQRCGDGIRDTGEVCDDGNLAPQDGCTPDCLSDETCGNGYVDFLLGELCDNGNALNHDGCNSGCLPEAFTWKHASFNSPSPRSGHVMAYDATRDRVVLFGGYDGTYRNDTWEWDGSTWTLLSSQTSPPPRTGHAMAYDATRGRIVLFGGDDGI
jgi:cysteine-rich repeat protein